MAEGKAGVSALVVGLDLSLTCTGVAERWRAGEIVVHRVQSKGRKDASLDDRRARLLSLTEDITYFCGSAALVVVESPAFSRTQGQMHDRSGLWWMVVSQLGNCVVEVTPGGRAKYATGKGNASKDEVLAAVVRRYPNVEVTNNNEADALILAAMGARHLGEPIDDLPMVNLTAMNAVHWPVQP